MKILGIDPGLRKTGWGIIEKNGNSIKGIACGVISPNVKLEFAQRLLFIFNNINQIITEYKPEEVAVEETFMNNNASSALKLGHARAMAIICPAINNIKVFEYAPNTIKKSLVGVGHAEKSQVEAMVKRILPTIEINNLDSSDALAIAITHAHSN